MFQIFKRQVLNWQQGWMFSSILPLIGGELLNCQKVIWFSDSFILWHHLLFSSHTRPHKRNNIFENIFDIHGKLLYYQPWSVSQIRIRGLWGPKKVAWKLFKVVFPSLHLRLKSLSLILTRPLERPFRCLDFIMNFKLKGEKRKFQNWETALSSLNFEVTLVWNKTIFAKSLRF